MKKRKHNIDFSLVIMLVITVTILLGLFNGIWPCAVVSGSMEPNLPTWSLCIVNTKAPYDSIQTGDIVIYNRRSDNLRIIHRVIEIQPDGMVTKGDANQVSDGVSVGRDNLFGKCLFHIPYLGYCSKVMQIPFVRIAVFVCLAASLVTDIMKARRTRLWRK